MYIGKSYGFTQICICLLFLCQIIQHTTQHAINLMPKNQNQAHQLNEKSQFDLKTIKRHGWLIEANKNTKFIIYFSLHTATTKQDSSDDSIVYVYFTKNPSDCHDFTIYTHTPIILNRTEQRHSAVGLYKSEIDVLLQHSPKHAYYMCLQNATNGRFVHQGTAVHLSIITFENTLHLWFQIVIYVIFVALAATFNGLNLGLMSLSINELKVLMKTSDCKKERKYAENILPLRKKGNFLLCSILLSITLSTSVSTLMLDDMTSDGFIAGLLSTIILCVFSEILPQAVCSKYSLPIGSYSRKFTYVFIILTSPISYPFSKIIDAILGKEVPTEYNRDRIKELMKKSHGLQDKELKIISGALDFKHKKISDIMIKLDEVFMINENVVLDFNTMLYIYNSGYSRIPIYHDTKDNIIGWLHIKDLCLIDPHDMLPMHTLLNLFKHKVNYFHYNCRLDQIFDIFRRGDTHLAFVYSDDVCSNNTISGTNAIMPVTEVAQYKKCIGIVTLHDVIEALVQFEINDEFDYTGEGSDRYGAGFLKQILSKYAPVMPNEEMVKRIKTDTNLNRFYLDTQLKLVLIQRLCSIQPFKEDYITKNILEQLISNSDNLIQIRIPQKCIENCGMSDDCIHYIYKHGKASSSFIFLIEGELVLEIGTERIEYTVRQFEYFGVKALMGDCVSVQQILDDTPTYKPYIPEYSLKIDYKNYWRSNACTSAATTSTCDDYSPVVYLKIDRNTWLNAVKTTQLKKSTLSGA